MKTFESNIGCRNIRREIEEAGQDEALSPAINIHLTSCGECGIFFDQQFKLRAIVASLGTVEAPNDFEFRLRARIAGEKNKVSHLLTIGNLSFGHRITACLALLLLIGSAFLVLRLDPGSSNPVVAVVPQVQVKPSATTPGAGNEDVQAASPATSQVNQSGKAINSGGTQPDRSRDFAKATQMVARRPTTRDQAKSPAKVVRLDELVAEGHSVFPIDSAPQALKVSVNNGRGTPKTISVPGVSFGSQRVLTQNPTPLMASSRGAW
ncbi:MAG TPA: hypothetical protein VNO50_21145 [Pyrinomonadaceae bacterium]|nr:hypothetical protein [Pyrinomonadaceae bacterium]